MLKNNCKFMLVYDLIELVNGIDDTEKYRGK